MYAVAAAHPEAVRIGMEILEGGGDACDCTVAMSLALTVAEPFYSSLGGGGVTLIWRAKEEKAHFIDFSNECSRHAESGMFPYDENGNHLNQAHNRGHHSILVPGLMRGLEAINDDFGSRPWEVLFEPAIRLAEEGFPVGWFYQKHQMPKRFMEMRESYSEFVKIHTKNGQPLGEGDLLRQVDLAATLRHLAKSGAEDFYCGEFGAVLEKEIRKGGGLVDAEDMAAYQVRKSLPLEGTYRDISYYTAPLPSSGLLLIQILNLLECLVYDWSDANEGERYVAFAKAMRSAFRDRFAVYGDSYHVSVPVEKLQSKEYAERVAGDEGSSSPHQHDIEAGSTTHFTIVDREGNIACHTQTLGAAWGSGVVIPGTGVLLNNHTNWMDPRPDFGNSIGPNRCPMAGYAPSLFFEKGKPRLAIGSPGSYRIPTAIAQVFLNSHHRGMPLQDAVEAPRIHFDAGPLQMEDDFSGDMAVALSEDGFEISTHPPHEHYFGGVNAVEIHEDGSLSTGADPRRGCLGDVAG